MAGLEDLFKINSQQQQNTLSGIFGENPLNTSQFTDSSVFGTGGAPAFQTPDFSKFGEDSGGFGMDKPVNLNGLGGDTEQGFNFDKLAAGAGAFKDIMGAYMAMKEFGSLDKSRKHQMGLDKTQLANNVALAQKQLNDRATTANLNRPGTYGTAPQLKDTIG